MQIINRVYKSRGFGRLYRYGIRQKYMITKEATKRIKIIEFWKRHGLEATTEAFGARKSSLYAWTKRLRENGGKTESLNPGKQARKRQNKREIHPQLLMEIKRLRLEVCPNMGKEKIKIKLDTHSKENNLPIYSVSKIGRIIKERKIYHHRQKFYHNGKLKEIKRTKKERKPKEMKVKVPGELVEIDTVVRFVYGLKRYILTAVDTYGRPAFAYGYERATSANAKDFYEKLVKAMPFEIKGVQTDNGSEFHGYFREHLNEQGVKHYYNYPGQPYRNGHVERFNRSIQDEFIDSNEFWLTDIDVFNNKLMDWLLWYNTKRPHWGLGLKTPIQFLITNGFFSNMCWTNTKNFFLYKNLL
jgi:transposase InsO family protein